MSEQPTRHQLSDWLREFIGVHLDVPAEEVALDLPLGSLGVDSATTLVLAADLTALLRREIRPAEIFEHPSIEKLAAHLTSPVTQEAAA
ncbi:hypothetical protein BIV25_22575 [Streptomyces sp. MUSC 14]|uniref:acyl carrier protein n=1 Tax=Streptomyces sp. MUSC 14 TaxID=1354889 RepID=UPI0008F599A4|nr:acyl carrier protein [Streptomyces sp. MUSC 14]OIJ94392.1 hypothetical protein BIV25_22575 [Streptomyces sp. MUSC 14]